MEMWYIYTIEYYSTVKKNEIIKFSGKWIELETIILSEDPDPERQKVHVFFHMWMVAFVLFMFY